MSGPATPSPRRRRIRAVVPVESHWRVPALREGEAGGYLERQGGFATKHLHPALLEYDPQGAHAGADR